MQGGGCDFIQSNIPAFVWRVRRFQVPPKCHTLLIISHKLKFLGTMQAYVTSHIIIPTGENLVRSKGEVSGGFSLK
jgi:hypothetical protein